MITVIDLKQYTEAYPKNYKQIPIKEAVPPTVCTEFSRYEVLRGAIRKLYFDIDGVPEDKPTLVDDFVTEYNKFLIKSKVIDEPLKFIKTSNAASPTHSGLSYHLICPTAAMLYYQQRDALLTFKHTEEGKPFNDYVDVSVYSKLRLFKLPNFIGIPMTDPENYHRMDPSYPDPIDYLIQYVVGCDIIETHFEIKKGWRKEAARISPLIQVMGRLATLLETPQILAKARNIEYSLEEIIKRIDALLSNPAISVHDQKMLKELYDDCSKENCNVSAIASGLLTALEEKYKQ